MRRRLLAASTEGLSIQGERKMRKFAIALGVTAALVSAGGLAWQADATTWRSGTLNLPSAAKNYSPVEETACYGWGKHCPWIPLVLWSSPLLVCSLLGKFVEAATFGGLGFSALRDPRPCQRREF